MTAVEIEIAKQGLSFFDKIAGWFRNRDNIALKLRLDAIKSVHAAATRTREYISMMNKDKLSQEKKQDFEREISMLWMDSAEKMAALDKGLSVEMYVKAYGWSQGGVWNSKDFEIIPRKVEKIYNDTLQILREFEPMFKL